MANPSALRDLDALFEASPELAHGWRKWRSREVATLEEAFGLSSGRGQRDPRTALAIAERDHRLRLMALRHFAGQPVAQQAKAVAAVISRYRAGADWRRDRTRDTVDYRHTVRGDAWSVLRAWDVPLAAATIRDILRTS